MPQVTACTAPFQNCQETKTCPAPSTEAGVQTGGSLGAGGTSNSGAGGSVSGRRSGRSGGEGNAAISEAGARSADDPAHERDASATGATQDASTDASDDGGREAGSTVTGCAGASVPVWYEDCDGDGYSPSLANGGISSCVPPPTSTACIAWTGRKPTDKANTDCNDHNAAYHPGADFDFPFTSDAPPPPNSPEYDLNCDGQDTLDTDATYVTFLRDARQTVTWCPDAYVPGCCITNATILDACCGCTLGVYIGCGSPMLRGDVTAYFRCR